MKMRLNIVGLFLFILGFSTANAELCGGPLNDNSFDRPLDYTSDLDKYGFSGGSRNKLRTVEKYHFDKNVEMLVSGINVPLPGDIDYTLRHFPNHYRALHSMATWHLQNPNPDDAECNCLEWLLPAECYFTRAMTFTPSDPVLYYIFGIYLHKKQELDRALDAYNDALKLGLDSAEVHYNLGLLQVDLKNYESARAHAKIAYAKGVSFPALRNKLKKAGEW